MHTSNKSIYLASAKVKIKYLRLVNFFSLNAHRRIHDYLFQNSKEMKFSYIMVFAVVLALITPQAICALRTGSLSNLGEATKLSGGELCAPRAVEKAKAAIEAKYALEIPNFKYMTQQVVSGLKHQLFFDFGAKGTIRVTTYCVPWMNTLEVL